MSGLPIEEHYVRFEVFTTVTMMQAVFWDVAPCRTCVNRLFGATCSCWFLAHGFFYHEGGGDTFLRNVGSHILYSDTSQKTAFFNILMYRLFDSYIYGTILQSYRNTTLLGFSLCHGDDNNAIDGNILTSFCSREISHISLIWIFFSGVFPYRNYL
jgi:hypothetical protein